MLSLRIKWKSACEEKMMAVKVSLDNVREDEDDIVTRGYDACKFSKKLFSKTIDSD
jgi:hypothetical protein